MFFKDDLKKEFEPDTVASFQKTPAVILAS